MNPIVVALKMMATLPYLVASITCNSASLPYAAGSTDGETVFNCIAQLGQDESLMVLGGSTNSQSLTSETRKVPILVSVDLGSGSL